MRKILSLALVLMMVLSLGSVSFAEGEMTAVGTPRAETLIVECQSPTDVPGQFNSYMMGTQMGFGIQAEKVNTFCRKMPKLLHVILCHFACIVKA